MAVVTRPFNLGLRDVCCLIVHSEIDKNIEHMTNLRKDKMVVDKELRT